MTVTWQDLEDAQAKRLALLDGYVHEIASEPSIITRMAMAIIHTTWSKWVRDWDFDNEVTTEWAGPLDHLMVRQQDKRAISVTAGFAKDFLTIDNDLLKKELQQ